MMTLRYSHIIVYRVIYPYKYANVPGVFIISASNIIIAIYIH